MFSKYESRILILGSNTCGAQSFRVMLEADLSKRGMTLVKVNSIRYIDKIKPNIRQQGPPELQSVVLFPEMRQMVGILPRFVRVYEEEVDVLVKRLCRERNVPLFEINNWKPSDGVNAVTNLWRRT